MKELLLLIHLWIIALLIHIKKWLRNIKKIAERKWSKHKKLNPLANWMPVRKLHLYMRVSIMQVPKLIKYRQKNFENCMKAASSKRLLLPPGMRWRFYWQVTMRGYGIVTCIINATHHYRACHTVPRASGANGKQDMLQKWWPSTVLPINWQMTRLLKTPSIRRSVHANGEFQ